MTFYKWSQTASADATADSTINWAEGQAPSSVNDSARAMMAATAKYRDDIAGAIVTGGTSTAYTVTSYEVFDTLAHMNGQMIAFTPHATNAATVTLNVDSLGARPLRSMIQLRLIASSAEHIVLAETCRP
jgi:fatty acid/phospholipid biosynthesis enzyme